MEASDFLKEFIGGDEALEITPTLHPFCIGEKVCVMDEQSHILKSFLLNQILWFIPSFVAMISPILIFIGLGVWWVGQNRFWGELFVASIFGFIMAWGTLFLVRFFRLPRRKTAKMESAARREVERFVENFDYKSLKITEWEKILEATLTLNAMVAREYGIQTKNPELDLPLSYVLLATERISADLNRFLDEKVKFLNVKPLEWLQLKHLFYFTPSGENKNTENGKDSDDIEQNRGGMLEKAPSFVIRLILSQLFRVVGYYSVMLYSGKLRYMVEPEDQWKFPLQASVWNGGRVGNSVASEVETASWIRRILAGTPEAGLFRQEKNRVTYRLPISEWGEILLSCGKLEEMESGMSKKKSARAVLMEELQETDLILRWISVAELAEILSASENTGQISAEWKRKYGAWRNIPEKVRPLLRFVVELGRYDVAKEDITQDLAHKIGAWLQLKPEEVHVWFWSEEEVGSGNKNENKMVSERENEFLALKKLLKLCDSEAQALRERKSSAIASEKKEDGRYDWLKSFRRSRLMSVSWAMLLYTTVLAVAFFVCGMMFAKEKLTVIFHGERSIECVEMPKKETEPTLAGMFFRQLEERWIYLAATLVGLGLLFVWNRFRLENAPIKVEAYPYWSRREKEAFKTVSEQIHALEEEKWRGLADIGGALMEVLKRTDQVYCGQETPRYAVSFAELLGAQQVLIGRLQRTLATEIPGLDYLRLRDVKWGIRAYSIYLRTFELYRKILWLEPISALALEFRRFVHGVLLRLFSQKMKAATTVYALDLASYYAVELYSGHIFYRKEEEPTRIFVIGQEGTEFQTLAEKCGTLAGRNCALIEWTTSRKGMKKSGNSGFGWFWRRNPSHFERCREEIKNADIVMIVTDSCASEDEYDNVKAFRTELEEACRQVESAPIIVRVATKMGDKKAQEEDVIVWDSDENLDAEMRNILKKKAEELRWRQEFRFLRRYSEKHAR